MNEIEITYVTEDPGRLYATSIRRAKTISQLINAIEPYRRVADDALIVARGLSTNDFSQFRKDLPRAAKRMPEDWIKKFNERFGVIAMPAKMMIASLIASEYKVPWGTAVIRCEEEKWPMLKK